MVDMQFTHTHTLTHLHTHTHTLSLSIIVAVFLLNQLLAPVSVPQSGIQHILVFEYRDHSVLIIAVQCCLVLFFFCIITKMR